jgi:lactoylglutathione lyase
VEPPRGIEPRTCRERHHHDADDREATRGGPLLLTMCIDLAHAGYAEFATGEARFTLYERRRAAWLTGGDPVLGPTGEAVFVVDDVDSQAIRLTSLGIDVLNGPVDRPWGHQTLHIADPDGFVVEFDQPIPRTRSRKNETQAAGQPVE